MKLTGCKAKGRARRLRVGRGRGGTVPVDLAGYGYPVVIFVVQPGAGLGSKERFDE